MWLFLHIMKKRAKEALPHCVSVQTVKTQKEEGLTTYCQLFIYFVETYIADNVINKTEADVKNFKQLSLMTAVWYSKASCQKR